MLQSTRHFVRIVAFGLSCVAWCADATQVPPLPPPQALSYKLAFSDDFDALDLSSDGSGTHAWYEGVWFNHHHAPAANIFALDSLLSLKWQLGQDSTDTSIATFSKAGQGIHAWRYGYFEARMKWDVVKGAWPAFWLLPVQDAQGLSTHNGVRESGEIDIFEGQGDQPHTYFGTIHDWVNLKSTANKDNHFALPNNVDLSQFHVYGILWTPGKINWYLDNQFLHAENTPAILDKEDFFIVLGMQEGVNWKLGDTLGVTAPEMLLNVDWVRVWQK